MAPIEIAVTHLRHSTEVMKLFKEALPGTHEMVLAVNRSIDWKVVVAPSSWAEERRQHGCVGTALDYLVGVVWGGQSLEGALARAEEGLFDHGSVRRSKLVARLRELLERERPGGSAEAASSFVRALGLLAHLDATFRAAVDPPEWTRDRRRWGIDTLEEALRLNYPDDFVDEVRALYAVSALDLPRHEMLAYNPVFGQDLGSVILGADGDLLIDDLLLDLKVSKERRFRGFHLYQLLCYAALDHLAGGRRVRRVGLYNPRYRAMWSMPADRLAENLGATSVESFAAWLSKTAPVIGRILTT